MKNYPFGFGEEGGMFCKCKLKLNDKHGMGYLKCWIALIELGF